MEEGIRIQTPLTEEVVKKLKIGERYSSVVFYIQVRDAAHKRLVDLIKAGGTLLLI